MAAAGEQDALVRSDRAETREMIIDAYRLQAPRRLVALLDG
jgi:hypothetical protein